MKATHPIIFTILLKLLLTPGTVHSQASLWDGTSEQWVNGSGTLENPYLIESARHLAWLAEKTNQSHGNAFCDTCFLLTTDLDLGADKGLIWTPIGVMTHKFCGNFDGNGHSIDNMAVFNDSLQPLNLEMPCAGLFGWVRSGSIRNLSMLNRCRIDLTYSNIRSLLSVGMIVGKAESTHVADCHNHGNIRVRLLDGYFGANIGIGGIIGVAAIPIRDDTGILIEGCSNKGCVRLVCPGGETTDMGPWTGGILGGTIDDHFGWAWIDNDNVVREAHSLIKECHNSGDVAMSLLVSTRKDQGGCGGIVGNAGFLTTMTHCSNTGYVSLSLNDNGTYSCRSGQQASGIVGGYGKAVLIQGARVIATILYCYNHADVRCESQVPSNTVAAGISAEIQISEVAELIVRNCYHVGEIHADSIFGVVSRKAASEINVSNAFFEDSNGMDNGYGSPKSEQEMKTSEFVNLLNADSVVFCMDLSGINGGYPVFSKTNDIKTQYHNVFLAYPNPAKSQVTVTGADIRRVEIRNLLGQQIVSMEGNGSESVTIGLSDLPKGVYLVNVWNKEGVGTTKKLIVE